MTEVPMLPPNADLDQKIAYVQERAKHPFTDDERKDFEALCQIVMEEMKQAISDTRGENARLRRRFGIKTTPKIVDD